MKKEIAVEIMKSHGWEHYKFYDDIKLSKSEAKKLSENEVTLVLVKEKIGNQLSTLIYFKDGDFKKRVDCKK